MRSLGGDGLVKHSAINRQPREIQGEPEKLLLEYARSEDPDLKREIASHYQGLVVHLAKGFLGRGEALEDLIQQGYIGLLKAIERFDPDRGVKFTTYATPTINGEIRRYFRDKGWDLHVPRGVKERQLRVKAAKEKLMGLGETDPSAAQIAEYLQEEQGDVEKALLARRAYNSYSLHSTLWDQENLQLMEVVGQDDDGYEQVMNCQDIAQAIRQLPEREQKIVQWRFFGDLTQKEVGERLGISQMHVSRLERRALKTMRKQMVA